MTAAEAPWGKNKPVLFASASRWVCRSPDGTSATGRTPGEAWNQWAQTHSVRPYVDYALSKPTPSVVDRYLLSLDSNWRKPIRAK